VKHKVLLIENNSSWGNNFKKIFTTAYGIEVTFYGFNEFLDLQDDINFNEYTCCLTDLELGSQELSNKDKNIDVADRHGKNTILPILKERAFWLPVACITGKSKFFLEIMHHISFSDFDCLIDKQAFLIENNQPIEQDYDQAYSDQAKLNPKLSKNKFEEIITNLTIKRNSSMMGLSYVELKRSFKLIDENYTDHISIDDKTEECINEIESFEKKDFLIALSLLGLHKTNTNITAICIGGGRSGEYTTKINCQQDGESKVTSWFIKWGFQKRKLQKEIKNYTFLSKSNIDLSLLQKTFFSNIVLWKNYGFLVYGFADDAITGYDYINKNGFDKFFKEFLKTAKKFYIDDFPKVVLLSKEVKMNFHEKYIPTELLNTTNNDLSVTYCIIHGDMHLRNVIYSKEKFLFIDFEKSTTGAIALDLAKLTIDLALNIFLDGLKTIPSLDYKCLIQTPLSELLHPFIRKIMKKKDDLVLFNVFLICYAKRYLDYDNISNDKKEVLERLIKNTCDQSIPTPMSVMRS
jgi:hypothetical protein